MAQRRGLTAGEIELAREAFGNAIEYSRVTLCRGAAANPVAHLAFFKGNPAITLGSTIYFKRDFCADFCAPGANRAAFIHEMTHVWQYQRLGLARFLWRYGREFVRAGGVPGRMYRYAPGETRFAEAMLEAQAEMVADYGEALRRGLEARAATLASNLAGSGLYGLEGSAPIDGH